MPSTYTTQSGVTLGRDAFIAHYVAAWLAALSVQRYWHGEPATCADNQPLEDALICATTAWETLQEIKP